MKWMTHISPGKSRLYKRASLGADSVRALSGIGKIHEQARHDPTDPATANSYDVFKQHLAKQYADLTSKGVKFHFTPHDPYQNSQDMRNDFNSNNAIKVYNVHDLPSDHPLAENFPGTKQSYNSIFRGLHDVYGHAYPGHSFGPKGELGAYQEHGRMFPKEALPALAAETLGQNAWVNYGPHNPQVLHPSERPFAQQKAYAFPQDVAEKMLTHAG